MRCSVRAGDHKACSHPSKVQHNGYDYCGRCGMGMSEGGPKWIRPELEPGYKERMAAAREKREREEEDRRKREKGYDLSGIFLDYGITGLDDEELDRMIKFCTQEKAHREKAAAATKKKPRKKG